MSKRLRLTAQLLAVVALSLLFTGTGWAVGHDCVPAAIGRLADLQSRSALQQFVRCAARHVDSVGWEQAMEDFAADAQWRDGPIYLFGVNEEGAQVFDTGVPGGPEDYPGGRPPVDRLLYTVGTFGHGYVAYDHRHPETRQYHPKMSYFFPADTPYQGSRVYLGAGYYPMTAPGTCDPDRVRASLVYSLEDAERFVRCAELYIADHGLRALYDLAHDPRWRSGPTYLFLLDRETQTMIMHAANPDLVGVDVGEFEDSTGFRYAEEAVANVAVFGEAVTYYEFRNPVTGAVEPKISYGRNVNIAGFDYILGAGIYVPANLACLDVPAAGTLATKAELELFVECAASMVAQRGTEVFDLLLNHRTWIDGPTYIFINDQECGSVLYPLDYRSDEEGCDTVTDAEGTLLLKEIRDVALSDTGRGYVSYIWFNPAAGEEQVKTSYVVGVELEGQTVAVGAGLYGLE